MSGVSIENEEMKEIIEKNKESVLLPPSRQALRNNIALSKKVFKKWKKGHTPRKIAHELGYYNIDEGEKEIKQFIVSVMTSQ